MDFCGLCVILQSVIKGFEQKFNVEPFYTKSTPCFYSLLIKVITEYWTRIIHVTNVMYLSSSQIQHVTYNEYLPVVLGKETMDKFQLGPQKMGFFSGYDINTNPGTANSVASTALRYIDKNN